MPAAPGEAGARGHGPFFSIRIDLYGGSLVKCFLQRSFRSIDPSAAGSKSRSFVRDLRRFTPDIFAPPAAFAAEVVGG
jgi:hypothetical protein